MTNKSHFVALCGCIPIALILLAACNNQASSANWVTYSSTRYHFTAQFPEQPHETNTDYSDSRPPMEKIDEIYINRANGHVYDAGCLHYQRTTDKPINAPHLLDILQNKVLKEAKGTILGSFDTELQGHPGREVTFDTDDNIRIRMRIFAVQRGRDVYYPQVIASMGKDKTATPDIVKFLNSLKIMD